MEKNESTGFSIRFVNRFFGIQKNSFHCISNQILDSYDYDIEYWVLDLMNTKPANKTIQVINDNTIKHMSLYERIQFPPKSAVK